MGTGQAADGMLRPAHGDAQAVWNGLSRDRAAKGRSRLSAARRGSTSSSLESDAGGAEGRFPERNGRDSSPQPRIGKQWTAACRAAGVAGRVPNPLRRDVRVVEGARLEIV